MAITESKKLSDLEKRLKLLRQQVYGREKVSSIRYRVSRVENSNDNTDVSYLNQDLLKILTLSSLAIGAQVILFNLNLF